MEYHWPEITSIFEWLNSGKLFTGKCLTNKRKVEMPLVKGKKAKTKKGFSENVRREVKEGKPIKQSVAIAYSEARGKKKKGKK